MAAAGNAAENIVAPDVAEEPSMDEILASIRQIIADDEATPAGVSERELYTHPTEHSNANEAIDSTIHAELEREIEAAIGAELAPVTVASTPEPDVEQIASAGASVAAVAGGAMSLDERLRQYRVRAREREIEEKALVEKEQAAAALEEAVAAAKREQEAAEASAKANGEDGDVEASSPETTVVETPTAEAAKADAAPTIAPISPASPAAAFSPLLARPAAAKEVARELWDANSAKMSEELSSEMRPIVRQWLSDNLPSIVERLVREEIERASRARKA